MTHPNCKFYRRRFVYEVRNVVGSALCSEGNDDRQVPTCGVDASKFDHVVRKLNELVPAWEMDLRRQSMIHGELGSMGNVFGRSCIHEVDVQPGRLM